MSSTRLPDDYLLSRDYVDCDRLNLQHGLWTKIFGYLLHPCIDASHPTLRIADIGTGTASWLTDLTEILPATCKLDGFDVDTSQAPPREWLPANVSLLLVFVVKGDPTRILRGLIKMLKPGGWLQWVEPDVRTMRLLRARVSASPSPPDADATSGMERLFSLSASQDLRLVPQWPGHLGDYFRVEGLTEVLVHRVAEAPPHLEFAMHQCNLLMYEMFTSRAPGPEAKEILDWVPRAADETRLGAMFAFERLAVVGWRGCLR
ncbi:hypothetical protein BDV06DRAFT_217050 [Aspergillus oleicola]